jgi:transcriptional regulator with XRE-family HTH domain
MTVCQWVIETCPVAADIANGYPQRTVKPRTIGANLSKIRGKTHQKDIAARMGIEQARLSNWERDRFKDLKVKTLLELAIGYQCTVEDILDGVDPAYDLVRHSRVRSSAPHHGGAVDKSSARSLEEELAIVKGDRDVYKAALGEVSDVAGHLGTLIARLSEISETGTNPPSRGSRRR